ncbi:hypothetical protein [Schinkia azotoformans]|uniref:hypothetical protein n=1 Tax=Schinkia azotoformans TaxID=1454 RepID=UPI002DB80F85|nr:hypothetical protein [Schinkia azotoformans]MEC1716586.1 hypothetical protein [Schinkia azotoformans]MEC1739424.1 hypothetical protein [Schinkia azotoformans]MEC1745506.1 hypothetical protein [Schinkia azotoformans]MEC1756569.1 hypothetical protein [Schinkia azotoformans]MEC1765836.1 hypothetical protein [Schinkia azotoformans]
MKLDNLFYATQELNNAISSLYQANSRIINENRIPDEIKQELKDIKEQLFKTLGKIHKIQAE